MKDGDSHPVLERMRDKTAHGWDPPVARLVGFKLTRIEKGKAKVELSAGRRHANPMGSLHGGVLCDIADAAMGMAYASLLREKESFATIELKMSFIRPFWTGTLFADGKVIQKGRTVGFVECRITDTRRRLIAYATSTCMTIEGTGSGISRPRRRSP